ncbi:hypothetical protein [Pseudoxanthomonas sp. UTMC 1351]|uniref:hypothetical protein n=1 Tax=Pseudoxanthomonas sp. UTMC 1351 TaxID=2695853 RepID=UPI0034CDD81C
MADEADRANAEDERAMARFEMQLQEQRVLDHLCDRDPTRVARCRECRLAIDPERLLACPRTQHCTECAAGLESGHFRAGR